MALHTSSYPGVNLYPGSRAAARIQASGQDHPSGQSGRTVYPGIRAGQTIRAVGQNNLSGQSGRTVYPGSRAEQPIRAVGQNNLSGQLGKTVYLGSLAVWQFTRAKQSIREEQSIRADLLSCGPTPVPRSMFCFLHPLKDSSLPQTYLELSCYSREDGDWKMPCRPMGRL